MTKAIGIGADPTGDRADPSRDYEWSVSLVLTTPSPEFAEVTYEGSQMCIAMGEQSLKVTKISAPTQDSARRVAFQLANHFLDGLAREGISLELDPRNSSVSAAGRTFHRLGMESGVRVSVGGNQPTARGTIGAPIKPHVSGSEAASYYRKAALANDKFDQFRNYYLAVENIADKITGPSAGIKEKAVLEDSMRVVFQTNPVELIQSAERAMGSVNADDPIPETVSFLYVGNRCQLNHAKASQDKLIPFRDEDEQAVARALPLVRFVAEAFLTHEEQKLNAKEVNTNG
ncbi:MAG: methylamine utilization protein MauJ [Dehalococcoidia bacterium]